MIALSLCLLALLATFVVGRRSLGSGLVALFAFGYVYGILRANLLTSYSHFIFDAGVVGLYLSQKWNTSQQTAAIQRWVFVMMAWCCLLALMPFQPMLISLVGLRGNAFFLPLLLLGSRLKDKDLTVLARGLAVLNSVALMFAWAEYFQGVPRYYPFSAVTQIIYISGDVAGGFFRIPAIFSSAHAYGGTMVASLPFLIGAWDRPSARKYRFLVICGMMAALLGILMSATRQNFVLGSLMIVSSLMVRRQKFSSFLAFALLIAAVGWAAATNTRFQRFKTLSDTEAVTERIAGSVNRGFFEILAEYPMGNGLGGGGTSIPYFLENQVRNPIGMENDYARILSEQGVVGLLIWISFVLWFISRAPVAFSKHSWSNARRMAWCVSFVALSTAWIGVGFLTSIPQTVLYLLAIGWVTTPEAVQSPAAAAQPSPRRIITQPAGILMGR